MLTPKEVEIVKASADNVQFIGNDGRPLIAWGMRRKSRVYR